MIIDTFFEKAWAFKLKRKTGKAIFDVMKPFFQSRKPQKIQFDQGTEFYNKLFLGLSMKHKIDLVIMNFILLDINKWILYLSIEMNTGIQI
jgi:hypothetical protein